MKPSFASLLITIAACAPPTPPVLVPQVQAGPASGVRPNRVLVLSASCGSVEYRCPLDYVKTVDAIVRGGLEFAGYSVVDSETLRDRTRQRHEEHDTTTTTESSQSHTDVEKDLDPFDEHVTNKRQHTSHTESSHVVLDGPGFEDLSIDERHGVLAKAGADSIVSVRIVIGGQLGQWTPNQHAEVTIKLGVNQGDVMAWASRCMASSNDFSTVSVALEHAARCAVHGATMR